MSTPRSANDVEVQMGRGLLPVRAMEQVSVSSCDLHALMAMNSETPKYQATGVSSGQEAPKTASLSPTVLRLQH